ncbi:non-reducing end alpha-L-arabinofuranosidase family hydrolase [Maribacter sp. 2304DJ31-5]|uniref:non-reducing end alpha-L-arabinofuranosidase family hydrolase n=1 Tax=Maribacter sp. 2304DJ31-5 TaxID=3386273 RepID=UPI0039BC4DB9
MPNNLKILLYILFIVGMNGSCYGQSKHQISWTVNKPVFKASSENSFDDVSVKDPSIVHYNNKWHLFYTAFGGPDELQIGYTNASELSDLNEGERNMLVFSNVENLAKKYAAPQVFYFEPQKKWYLVFQGYWNNVQPLYSTTDNIEDYTSWTQPKPLIEKFEENDWVDFYVVCDKNYAYLTYSRNYKSVYAVRTKIEDFPIGFDLNNPIALVESPNIEFGEAAHIYKAKGMNEYHMIYETSNMKKSRIRSYSLYHSKDIAGPWQVKYADYASKPLLVINKENKGWPEEVSHGEMIRTNYNQEIEYDPINVKFLMQGIIANERGENYTPDKYWSLPWKFGILETELKHN